MTGSVERQRRRAYSCGRVSRLGQRGKRANYFSGGSNKEKGAPRVWAHIFLELVARLVMSLRCIQVLFVLHVVSHAFDHYFIEIYFKLVFPGGILSRVVLTKNNCVNLMHGGFIHGRFDQK
jgi:hypothetical protein